ncbi:MAG TPA: 4Fe-4S dicluster domain-containing protein [Candidatus Bathyarchaeota archaeon]|nr:4Fe-4S dicluster domain-containing protein [Candidatus Bathyarchaeota archaeon]
MAKVAMTKDLLMQYTLVALFFIAFLSYNIFGLASLLICLISVGVAIGCDFLLSMVMGSKGPRNTMSAAVFGLIVALSYSLGTPPGMMYTELIPTLAGGLEQYLYPALISAVGLIVFKKLQGLAGRKFVNPAAAAKLLILGLLFMPVMSAFYESSALLPQDHDTLLPLQNPMITDEGWRAIYAWKYGGEPYPSMDTVPFAANLLACYSNNASVGYYVTTGEIADPLPAVLDVMLVGKYHGWIGGYSSIIVMLVGLALFAVCRRYIKWRITLAYLVATAVFSLVMAGIYGGDPLLRTLFHLFMGSSIFMAFFMATDPATTPLTHLGQIIFGVGLALLTMIIQVYMGFLGGSILALVIMNLTCPILDNIGKMRPRKRDEQEILSGQHFATTVYDCIRCGACMNICVNGLSPVLIKQARAKKDANKLMSFHAEYCAGCGNCNVVCPAGIYLESETLGYNLSEEEAKEMEQQFLTGTADEDVGVYTDIFSAKSSIDGQDGGVATSLLVSGMEKGLFDAAIVVQRMDGYLADAVVAENVDEVLKAKGTKYVRVSMMAKLQDLLKKGKRKIALVGTACQIRAARRLQQVLLSKYPDLELTLIGLFCYEIFDYKKLKEETERLLGVNLDDAEKTQITKGKYIVTVNGKDYTAKVKELSEAVEKRCLGCPDFTAMYADISLGSVGSADGYSTVIVRSDVGKELVAKLDLTKGKVDEDKVKQLSVQKKDRAIQNLAESGYW